jgi:hypothetical protein
VNSQSRLIADITLCLCLTASLIITGCRSTATTTPQPGNTTITISAYLDKPGDKIPVIVNPCIDDLEGKIRIDNITMISGTLDGKEPYSPLRGKFKAGDPCFLVSGSITNDYQEGSWVACHAEGYDVAGNWVAATLDMGPIAGVGQVYIDANNSENFILHLNWSDNVTSMEISFQRSGQMFP